jgi:hypothetical protein
MKKAVSSQSLVVSEWSVMIIGLPDSTGLTVATRLPLATDC